jgi:formamidopyrimidine-DNA glycosylase
MPELPEVETIKIGLSNKIIGKKIVKIEVETQKSFQGNKKDVLGTAVINVQRRAKTLRIKLSNGLFLMFHLKMTGQLIFIDKNERMAGGHPSHDWHDSLPNKHTRITFTFDDGTNLFFNDLRKFGWCKVLTGEELNEIDAKFGPEPFSEELNVDYLTNRAKSISTRTVKQFIMDQAIIAGVGNIYADESLFLASISPFSKANKLTKNDWQKLIVAIKEVLEMGIRYGGTTDSDYVNAEGKKGGMQDYLNVYHKTGEYSQNGCDCLIERTKIGGRGTFYCPCCQREIK